MILLSNQYDSLDSLIANAALGHSTWSDALRGMMLMVGADAMAMGLIFGDNRMVRILGTVNIDEDVIDAYAGHFYRIGPRAWHGQPSSGDGVILHEELRRPEDADEQDEFWSWFMAHNPPADSSMLIMPCIGDARLALAVFRNDNLSATSDIREFYQQFYSKFGAINLALRRKASPQDGPAAAMAKLQHIDCFSLVVDEDMRTPMSRSGPLLRYTLALTGLGRLDETGLLTDILPDFHSALIAMLQNSPPQQGMDLTLKTELADTMARVVPLPQSPGARTVEVHVTYMKHVLDPAKVFMGALGLTRRQAELLDVLRRVYALDEAAALMSISRNTARVFLAQIFERTGIRRKVDLLRLADQFA